MSAKFGEIIETASIQWASGQRMHFLVWQFVLTFDYHLFSMHLVHNQSGVLWSHSEHELIRRQCLFEFGKFFFLLLSFYFKPQSKTRNRIKIELHKNRKKLVEINLEISLTCIRLLLVVLKNVFVPNNIYSRCVQLTCFRCHMAGCQRIKAPAPKKKNIVLW